MNPRLFALPARLFALLIAVGLMGVAHAQSLAAQAAAPAKSQPAVKTNANDEMLAKAAKLYYSTAKAGLVAFDCAVHPEWHTLFVSASKGDAVAENDPRIVLLKSVGITLHGRLKGGSTLEWVETSDPGRPLDTDSTALLASMHQATEQTLQGFMQFWTPFVDGSVVPENSAGIEITKGETGYTLQADSGGTKVTEVIDNQLLLQHFNVVMKEATVDFVPAYKSTDKGLLVNSFQAHILAAGSPPERAQDMNVAIEYQIVQGFPLPSTLNMSVVGTGVFNFVLDGCTTNPQSK